MENKLVSIITPCYNTGNYVFRLLDSIVKQTYPHIEMYIVNDGSTDNTYQTIVSYKQKFDARGYTFHVINQSNLGQSVAIKKCLSLIKGDYLVWPDSDDFYSSPQAIETMVSTMLNLGNDFALVRAFAYLLEENTLKVLSVLGEKPKAYNRKSLFEDCLLSKNNFFFGAGAYMIDVQKFKSTTMGFYTNKDTGQNWQLLLPLLYHYNCYTINIPLYNIICRQSSHSRNQYKGYNKTKRKLCAYEKTLLKTIHFIKGITLKDRILYISKIKSKYIKERVHIELAHLKRLSCLYQNKYQSMPR